MESLHKNKKKLCHSMCNAKYFFMILQELCNVKFMFYKFDLVIWGFLQRAWFVYKQSHTHVYAHTKAHFLLWQILKNLARPCDINYPPTLTYGDKNILHAPHASRVDEHKNQFQLTNKINIEFSLDIKKEKCCKTAINFACVHKIILNQKRAL
jgi:hypothetical protein